MMSNGKLALGGVAVVMLMGTLAGCGSEPVGGAGSGAAASPGTVAIATQRAAAASPVPGTVEPVTIPVGFQGRWGVAEHDCDPSNPNATGGLTLGERSVTTFDAPGTPTSVAQPVPLTLTTTLSYHRADRTWVEPTQFRLVDGAKVLERTVAGTVMRFRRCPV